MKSLSIVIPAYNEERRLPETLHKITAWMGERDLAFREIIIVDDGCRDGTAAIVRDYAKTNAFMRLLLNPGNRGKGYAVRHGMLKASGDWVLSTDADLSSPIDEVRKLHAAAERSGAAIAIGSRALDKSLVERHQPAMREISGRLFNLAMRWATGLPFRDTQCGFKLYRAAAARQVFSRQKQDGFSFDVEDLVIAQRLGLRTVEVPVRWANAEGTTVSLWQGVRSFLELVQIRLDHRNTEARAPRVSAPAEYPGQG